MTRITLYALAALAALATATPALSQTAGGGRGGNESGGDLAAAAPGALLARFDDGCYRPGQSISIDWNGLAEFDGQIALVVDGQHEALPVTSYTDRAVVVSLGGVSGGKSFPVVWSSEGEVRAKIGELTTCSTDTK